MTQAFISGRKLLVALAFVASITSAQANTANPDTDTEARNEAIVRDAFEAWAAGGSVFELLSPDIVWTIHGSGPIAATHNGIEQFVERGAAPIVSRLTKPLMPDVHNIWAVDDTVIIRFDASSTTTSGNPYSNRYLWIFRMENGAVVTAEAFLDLVAYQDVLDNNEPRVQ